MDGANRTSIGNISSLPASISNIKTNFEKSLKPAKFPVGPTTPRPGPTLLIVHAMEEKFVVISNPFKETSSRETIKIIKYRTK